MPIIGIVASSRKSSYPTVSTVIAQSINATPYVLTWPWSGAGFGTKYANPSTLPTAAGWAVGFNKTSTALLVAMNASPYIHYYAWSGGFGSKYADPASLPTVLPYFTNQSFRDDTVVMSGTATATYAYPISASGLGTKYANPSTLPTTLSTPVFTPNGSAVLATSTTPNVIAYAWSGGFGAKYADPASPPPQGTVANPAVNFAGSAFAVGYMQNPPPDYASGTAGVWAWSSGWGTKYSNPAYANSNYYGSTATGFKPDDSAVSFSSYNLTNGDKLLTYAWNNSTGFGSKYADPVTIALGDARGMAWTANGSDIALSGNGTPYINVWPWSSGYGTKYAQPSTISTAYGNSVTYG